MNGASQKGCPVLVVLLQFQVGLNEALQDLIAVHAQRSRCARRGSGEQKRGKCRTAYRLEKNAPVDCSGPLVK